jgi:hypothetical protein
MWKSAYRSYFRTLAFIQDQVLVLNEGAGYPQSSNDGGEGRF